MANLFRSKKSEAVNPELSVAYDPFKSSREGLNTFLTDKIGKPGPKYEGDRVAPMSDLEKKSLEAGEELAERPSTGALTELAGEEVKRTLSGEYDPSTSPYYQALKAESERNLQKTNESIRDNASAGRRYFSGLRAELEQNASTDQNIALDKELGRLSENERVRRLATVPIAQDLEEDVMMAPAKKAQALQIIGSLPREIQQAYMDALYEDFYQSEVEYPINIAQLASGPSQQQPLFVQTGYTRPGASSFVQGYNQLSGPAIQMALSMMSNKGAS